MATFSTRHGLTPVTPPTTVRFNAPRRLKEQVVIAALNAEMTAFDLRKIICVRLQKAPDRDNTTHSRVTEELHDLLRFCAWHLVYDIIEDIAAALMPKRSILNVPITELFSQTLDYSNRNRFHEMINRVLRQEGIGWKLVDGKVEHRGDKPFETMAQIAPKQLDGAGLPTAAGEFRKAIQDLSSRSSPDLTGALQHSFAALECVARAFSGDSNMTLGDFLKKNPDAIPRPVDKAVEKLWGFASEKGRHLREDQELNLAEVQLAVHVAASVATYLSAKIKESKVAHVSDSNAG